MSLIQNLVKEPEKKISRKKDADENDDDEKDIVDKKPRTIVKTALDLQRLRVEKLMKNPEKPVTIPEPKKERDYLNSVPTFVRNVMGSSAGAGSGEFHVYRHLRRKEYARQKLIQAKSNREKQDEEYQNKIEENRRIAEEKTAKKRAKRLKKKERAKRARQTKKQHQGEKKNEDAAQTSESEGSSSEDESDNKNKVEEEKEPEKEKETEKSETTETEPNTDGGDSRETNDETNQDNETTSGTADEKDVCAEPTPEHSVDAAVEETD